MIKKIIYKDVDNHTVNIYVEDGFGRHHIGTAKRSVGIKWGLTAHFPVEFVDLEIINSFYEGPVEAGRRLVKAWDYYKSLDLDSHNSNVEDLFFGDLFK
tara:strand:- start:5565 stop:5861 length:297 start_codon:yes stop_codon:yes gene_type:complete